MGTIFNIALQWTSKTHLLFAYVLDIDVFCRYAKHIYERMPTPYQVYSWLAPQPDHTIDLVRMEDGKFFSDLCSSFSVSIITLFFFSVKNLF